MHGNSLKKRPAFDYKWSKELDSLEGERLVEAFMIIRERPLLKSFLSSVFTEKELTMFNKRFDGIYWLSLGMPYERIEETCGLSSRIVARLNKKFKDKDSGLWQVMDTVYSHSQPHFEETVYAERPPDQGIQADTERTLPSD